MLNLENIYDSLGLNYLDENNNNILQIAIINSEFNKQSYSFIKQKLKELNNLSCKKRNKFLNNANNDGNTAAHLALIRGIESDCEIVSKYMQKIVEILDNLGADLTKPNNLGQKIKLTNDNDETIADESYSDKAYKELLPSHNDDIFLSSASSKSSSSSKPLVQAISGYDSDAESDGLPSVLPDDYSEEIFKPKIKYDSPFNFKSPAEINSQSSYVSSDNSDMNKLFEKLLKPARKKPTNNSNTLFEKILEQLKSKNFKDNATDSLSDTESDIFEKPQTKKLLILVNKGYKNKHRAVDTLDKLSTDFNFNKMQSGGNGVLYGTRQLYLNDLSETQGGSDSKNGSHERSREGSRKPKPSSEIHQRVIKHIVEQGYSEEDARVIKSALYHLVKKKYPNLSNMERAKKLAEEAMDKDKIKKMDLKEARAALEKRKAEYDKARSSSEKPKKEKKTSTPKRTKKSKKSKKSSKY
jgi:hypothetical protein